MPSRGFAAPSSLPRDESRPRERGSAAVEFALVLPLVLTLTLALLQVGLLVKDQLVLVGGARAGAREATVTLDEARVRQAVERAAATLDPAALQVSVRREGGIGTAASVTVVYEAPISIPVVQWLFPDSVTLSATTSMRQETE